MSKVLMERTFAKDTFYVGASAISAGWVAGMAFQLDPTGTFAILGVVDNIIFIGVDGTTELSSPPSGSLITGIYGSGTRFIIDHTPEVAAGSSTRAYNTSVGNPESGTINANLYIGTDGKWTTTATGSVKGKQLSIPSAGNNFNLEIQLRF